MAKIQPCGSCEKDVLCGDKAMLCEGLCELWYHISCVNITDSRYQELQVDAENKWRCPTCDKEPFLSICKDIKLLQSFIFSISGEAQLTRLDSISSELKAFIYEITLRNESFLQDLQDEHRNKLSETAFDNEVYQSKMSKFQTIAYDPIDMLSSQSEKSSNERSNDVQQVEKFQLPVHLEKEKTPKKSLKEVSYSVIVSSTPDVFDVTDISSKESNSCDSIQSEVDMDNSGDTTDLFLGFPKNGMQTGETFSPAGKTVISSQQAVIEENTIQESSDHQPSSTQSGDEIESVPTSKSKTSASEPAGTGTGEYEVEDILDHMKVHDKTLFLVKWKNYGHESNSWENRENLTNCKQAISKYFRRALAKYENAIKNQKESLE